jgi:hypothetical protein
MWGSGSQGGAGGMECGEWKGVTASECEGLDDGRFPVIQTVRSAAYCMQPFWHSVYAVTQAA